MTERQINYLGALLHDIGKFKWRAQSHKAGDDHEKLGEEFIREYLGKIELLKNDIEKIIYAANRYAHKIKISDEIASQERQPDEIKGPRRPLFSILQRVNINKEKLNDNVYYYRPYPLKLKIDFPIDSKLQYDCFDFNEEEIITDHSESWNMFIEEIKNLKNIRNFKVFIETFYDVLHKYTARVLSAGYKSYPDISLFDHSRIVASLSICYNECDNNKECMLIYGDISGIQNYIYNDIYSKEKIAKKLRGRSFYVSLLSNTISRYFIDELELYIPNLLYEGGGHFLILAPNNKINKEKVKKIEEKINRMLYEKFTGKLHLILGTTEEYAEDVINKFNICFKNVKNITELFKMKKYHSIFEKLFSDNPINIFDIENKVSKLDNEEELIGSHLPKSNYIIEIYTKDNNILNAFDNIIGFSEINKYWLLSNDFNDKGKLNKILLELNKIKCDYIIVNRINDTDFVDVISNSNLYDNPIGAKFKFIGSYVPVDKNKNPLSFEELAKMNSENYPLLGIARMDVDSLGAIFAFGLLEENDKEIKYTISRIASLSRELDTFFTGYINIIAKKNNVYIAYSGGDDLFVVGSWINILEFVKEVQNSFTEYVCHNGNITISCGVVFTKHNFPIANSSQLAGIEEKRAKDCDDNQNSISVFFTPVKWHAFYELLDIGKDIFKIVNKQLPRSFIHKLLELTQECFDNKGRVKANMIFKVKSRLHYAFARRGIDYKEIQIREKQFLTTLAEYFLYKDNADKFFKNFRIPASYVIYKTRKLN